MKHVSRARDTIADRAMIGGHLDLPAFPEGVVTRTGQAALIELEADLGVFLAEVPRRLRPDAAARAGDYWRMVGALLALHPQASLSNDTSRGFRLTRREEGYVGSGSSMGIEHHVILPQLSGGHLYASVGLNVDHGHVELHSNCWREGSPTDLAAFTGYNRRDDERAVACAAALKAYMTDLAA